MIPCRRVVAPSGNGRLSLGYLLGFASATARLKYTSHEELVRPRIGVFSVRKIVE